jgi:hypothetical protein
MNMEDEEEYLDFYDFRKTYDNMPGVVMEEIKENIEEEKIVEKDKESEGSWEECSDGEGAI